MLLEVNNLKTEFQLKRGTVTAVNDISFSIDKGEILAIVGESGSGKSVTSLSVMGLLQPPGKTTQGEILFKGEDLLKKSKTEMQSVRGDLISMIFQEPMTSLNPVYRIKDQITESVITHMKLSKKEALERTIHMLEVVGIPSARERANDYPHQMSGGMRQRVMIAMALACRPELLIADEPTTALDVTIQAQVLDLLRKLRDETEMSILFITHDLGVVAEIADYVLVMYAGKIIEEAPVVQLFRSPRHPYTRGLLKSRPVIGQHRDRLYSIRGQVPELSELPRGCYFADRCESCMPACREAYPPSVEDECGHRVACLLHGKGECNE